MRRAERARAATARPARRAAPLREPPVDFDLVLLIQLLNGVQYGLLLFLVATG